MVDGSRALPLTEGLVLDIVDYLLLNKGYGYSTQISDSMVQLKPRRYTSREVVGILRNRPMFSTFSFLALSVSKHRTIK